jgi:DNA-binding transcriptional LysR family regulator
VDYTLQQLRYLVAVADHGSVSAAARSLYVSQPGLSSAILHLEDVFGIQCFIRHPAKGVSLTPAGQLFVEEAKDVLFRASNLRQRAKELNETIAGRLDVGCYTTIGPLLLPKILDKLHQNFPDIEVHLQGGDSQWLESRLKEGVIELALLYDLNLDPALEKLPLLSLPPYVLLSENHHLATQASIKLDDLASESLISFDRPEYIEYLRLLFAEVGRVPTIGRQVGEFELIRGLVAGGKGYSILNTRPALDQAYDGSPVKCIPISGIMPPATVVLASSGGQHYTSRAVAFLETCQLILGGFDARRCRWLSQKSDVADKASTGRPCLRHAIDDVIEANP